MNFLAVIEMHPLKTLAGVVAVWLLPPIVTIAIVFGAGSHDALGQSGVIGDTFNISTSILTALALICVVVSLTHSSKQIEQMQRDLLIQQEALRAQIQELQLNREELSRAAGAHEASVQALNRETKVQSLGSEISALTALLGGMESRYNQSTGVYKVPNPNGMLYNAADWQYAQDRQPLENRLREIISELRKNH
jgi:uncharacterized membrane protein